MLFLLPRAAALAAGAVARAAAAFFLFAYREEDRGGKSKKDERKKYDVGGGHTISPPIRKTASAATHATAHCQTMKRTAFPFPPISRFTAATAATQGA